jgi:hypothetical protein
MQSYTLPATGIYRETGPRRILRATERCVCWSARSYQHWRRRCKYNAEYQHSVRHSALVLSRMETAGSRPLRDRAPDRSGYRDCAGLLAHPDPGPRE